MIRQDTVEEVVARVFTAAGRQGGDAEVLVFAEALDRIPDDVAIEASRRLARTELFDRRPPSPALLLEYVALVETEHRARQPAIPSAAGPLADAGLVARELERARRLTKAFYGDEHRNAQPPARPIARSRPATAHDLGDHQFCDHPAPPDPGAP